MRYLAIYDPARMRGFVWEAGSASQAAQLRAHAARLGWLFEECLSSEHAVQALDTLRREAEGQHTRRQEDAVRRALLEARAADPVRSAVERLRAQLLSA